MPTISFTQWVRSAILRIRIGPLQKILPPPLGRLITEERKPTKNRRAAGHANSHHRYVPDGLSAAQWKKMQADKKKSAAANKLKYPKGAAQVVGVKEYLEDLAKKQTFFRDAAGNSRVSDTGHKWAKVKFGEFTKEAYDEWRAKGGKKLPNQMY